MAHRSGSFSKTVGILLVYALCHEDERTECEISYETASVLLVHTLCHTCCHTWRTSIEGDHWGVMCDPASESNVVVWVNGRRQRLIAGIGPLLRALRGVAWSLCRRMSSSVLPSHAKRRQCSDVTTEQEPNMPPKDCPL